MKTFIILALCMSTAKAHTCSDMSRAFDNGNYELGQQYVNEAVLPYWHDGMDLRPLIIAVMYVCKNNLAVDLRHAGRIAYTLVGGNQ